MTSQSPAMATIEPPDARVTSVQPGGGVCMQIELAWGRLRRWYLRRFRRAYLDRMRALRVGSCPECQHEVLDPRDLKYFHNVCGFYWRAEDDPFAWRDRLPLARVGLAEVLLSSLVLGVIGVGLWWLWPPAVSIAVILAGFIVWFFRDPPREAPEEASLIVAPADGQVVAIDAIEDSFVDGPALLIGIFLSVHNVHINRAPVGAVVLGQTYRPGKFLNALRPRSAQENEQLELRLQEIAAPHRRLRVRQIAGAIARRIVCWAHPGQQLQRGEQFGMIKIGSRTELVVPREESMELCVRVGEKVQAGTTVLARYSAVSPPSQNKHAQLEGI